MQKPLPARPSLEQLKKQAKELVRDHRMRNASAFALIREFLPSLTGKTDEEVSLYPFALHDAQSVIARQNGFPSWNQLRDHLAANSNHLMPDLSVDTKFKKICRAYEKDDYELFCSEMNEYMKTAVPKERFESSSRNLAVYFKTDYRTTYMGEMVDERDNNVYFWRLSAPAAKDNLVRMGVKDGLVTGILFSLPWGGVSRKK
jgi:hypothetical protein